MPIRVKSGDIGGGTWVGPLSSGNFRIKSGNIGGGSWISPAYVQVGDGTSWKDTGYVGYPAPPVNLAVNSWSYSAVALQWGAGAGGAPVSAYKLVQMNAAGTVLNQVEVAGSPWGNFSVNWDTRYQFYVQSKGASGLYSALVGPVRVAIGHPQQDTYGYVLRERPWQSGTISGWYNKGDWIAIYVAGAGDGRAGDVLIQGLHSRNFRTPQSGTVSGTSSRTLNHLLNNGDFGSVGTVPGGWGEDLALNNWSANSSWGYIPEGSGWSTSGNQYYQLGVDAVWLTGTERYNNYEVVSSIPAAGNGYW